MPCRCNPLAPESPRVEPDGFNYRRDRVFFSDEILKFSFQISSVARIRFRNTQYYQKYEIFKRLVKTSHISACERKTYKINLYIKLNINKQFAWRKGINDFVDQRCVSSDLPYKWQILCIALWKSRVAETSFAASILSSAIRFYIPGNLMKPYV